MPKHIAVLIAVGSLGTISAVYGGVSGESIFLGAGLPIAFLSLLFIPILYARADKRRRLFNRQDALLIWSYAPHETEQIAKLEAENTRKQSVRLSVLASVCLAVIFAPFVFLSEADGTRLLLVCIGVAAVLLPFISVAIAPAYTASQIKRIPSMTIVGRDYVLMNNRYIGINDRAKLTLVSARAKTGDNGTAKLILTYTFLMKYGNPLHYTVEVPVPWDRQDEAVRFADSIQASETT
jgi:hypothetical protein